MFYEKLIFVSKYVSNMKIKEKTFWNCEIQIQRRILCFWTSKTTGNYRRILNWTELFLIQDLNKMSKSISLILLLFVFEMTQIKFTQSTDLWIEHNFPRFLSPIFLNHSYLKYENFVDAKW